MFVSRTRTVAFLVLTFLGMLGLAGCNAIHADYDPSDPRDPNRPGVVTDRSMMTNAWPGPGRQIP
jgi:hypothetical protein